MTISSEFASEIECKPNLSGLQLNSMSCPSINREGEAAWLQLTTAICAFMLPFMTAGLDRRYGFGAQCPSPGDADMCRA